MSDNNLLHASHALLGYRQHSTSHCHPVLRVCICAGISGASYYEGSFSNIARSPAGDYVAVSSRGNFFMTWTPGQVRPEGGLWRRGWGLVHPAQ
jgi:hypothetical protein